MDPTEILKLRSLTGFEALVNYLRDELDWPIEAEDAEKVAFEYKPRELGIDERHAVKIESIRQIRPLAENQPWGVFYVEFESKQLPVLVLRRILQTLVPASRRYDPDRPSWKMNDLLFISSQGEAGSRSISFAHFRQDPEGKHELRTFSWDVSETHLYYIKNLNLEALRWPDEPNDIDAWRSQWGSAFRVPDRYVPKTAQMLAGEMARLARQIREAVEEIYGLEHSGGPLHQLHLSLKMTLITDLSEADFADMYAQTVTYGLFAARATHQREFESKVGDAAALIAHTNPFLRELLEQLMDQEAVDLEGLGVNELTDLLKQVDMDPILQDFGRQKRGEDPVIHFYETFMKRYDPVQKTRRGEFYTPDPVVSFIVRSVDHLLRTEFNCPDGLMSAVSADGSFSPVVLDPATGTGTFLKYVIEVVWQTFCEKHKKLSAARREEKWNEYVRSNLLTRLYGFELKMSPYTIAHLKLGLTLQQYGFEFQDGERLGVYLSNALQPAHEVPRVDTPALAHEVLKANEVKSSAPISVLIGNPPYSYNSSNIGGWISSMIKAYYRIDGKPLNEKNPKGLQDDYVKFLRYAEHLIAKQDAGIVALITNHGYLDNPTFRGLRQQLINSFSGIFVLDLHGSSIKKEVMPNGSKDENVFDIQTGVAICIMIKQRGEAGPANVFHADLYGRREDKYKALLLGSIKTITWTNVTPISPYYFFTPKDFDYFEEYQKMWAITTVMPTNSVGLFTARDHFAIQWTRESAEEVFDDFVSLKPESAREKYQLGRDSRDWQVILAQKDLVTPKFDKRNIKPITYRPFDKRFSYYSGRSRGIICMPRPEIMQHLIRGENLGLIFIRRSRDDSISNFFIARNIVDKTVLSSLDNANVAPLYLYSDMTTHLDFFFVRYTDARNRYANFSAEFIANIERILNLQYQDIEKGNLQSSFGPEDALSYIYAVFSSPTYRTRYAEFLKTDFPRLPLTSNLDLFRRLCALGADLVALHLLEPDYPSASWTRSGGSSPLDNPIARFTGSGDDTVAKGYPKFKDSVVQVNPDQGFEGVPEDVWEFHVGGYQVCQKWLKDRRGRRLSRADIAHYRKVVTALHETIRLMGEIDQEIDRRGGWPIQ